MKNVLADFGTRQLDPDECEDDDFELEDLFVSTPFDVITNLPQIAMNDYTQQDFEELENFAQEYRKRWSYCCSSLGVVTHLCSSKAEESNILGLPLSKA